VSWAAHSAARLASRQAGPRPLAINPLGAQIKAHAAPAPCAAGAPTSCRARAPPAPPPPPAARRPRRRRGGAAPRLAAAARRPTGRAAPAAARGGLSAAAGGQSMGSLGRPTSGRLAAAGGSMQLPRALNTRLKLQTATRARLGAPCRRRRASRRPGPNPETAPQRPAPRAGARPPGRPARPARAVVAQGGSASRRSARRAAPAAGCRDSAGRQGPRHSRAGLQRGCARSAPAR
jgi:hypothetical protein